MTKEEYTAVQTSRFRMYGLVLHGTSRPVMRSVAIEKPKVSGETKGIVVVATDFSDLGEAVAAMDTGEVERGNGTDYAADNTLDGTRITNVLSVHSRYSLSDLTVQQAEAFEDAYSFAKTEKSLAPKKPGVYVPAELRNSTP
ncbi:MAG: hypothetical protein ABIA93_01420 [Candidatus Woesearchaeota archaeon]